MKMYFYSFVCFCILGTTLGVIPDYIKVCGRNDPDIDACMKTAVEHLRPELVKGIKELNVPPLEPLKINTIKLSRGPQNARVDLNITDLLVRGPGDFVIQSIKSYVPKIRFDFKVLLPHINFKGTYGINMHVLLLRLRGVGPITGNITNLHCDVKIQGHLINKEGKEHIQFEKFKIKLNIGPTKFRLDNLFNGDPTLGRIANNVINNSPEFFVEEIKPALESALSDVFTGIANGIMGQFTFDEMFPV